jgi:hypothetical protein
MRTRIRGRAAPALAVAAAVVAAAGAAPPAGAAQSGAAQSGAVRAAAAQAAAQVATVPAPLARTVELPTGQRLLVGMTGDRVTGYRMLPGPGAGSTLLSFGAGDGDTYVVPAEAVGDIGTRLDLSLFDVTALARQDTAKPAARPHYPLHTLRISATGLPGAPADTPLGSIVLNTDDTTRFGTVVPVEDGEGTVQVPAGHYAVYTLFVDRDADGDETAWRQVVQDATVADGGDGATTVSAQESAADTPVTVSTPRPATADVLKLTWFRTGASGNVTFDSLQVGSPDTVKAYVNARPEQTGGGSRYVVQWGGASPAAADGAAADEPYRYDLAFGSDDVPDRQAYRADPGQLATVVQRFSADPAAGGDFGTLYVLPVNDETRAVEAGGQSVLPPPVDSSRQAMPGTRTEYVGTADGGAWAYSVVTPQLDTFESDIQTLAPGSTRTVDWGHGPLAPNLGVHRDQQLRMCTACAGDGQLDLYLPTADSEPDHIGSVDADYTFTLYRNGEQVVSAPDVVGARGVPGADGPADYRAVLDADRTAAGAGQSVTTRTEVAFHDPGPGDPQLALPADVPCPATGCRIMPALTLGYRLDSDQSNTSALAEQTMDLTVGHLSYDGRGSRAAITSAAVSVSFDGGATWRPAALTGGAGSYHAVWENTGGGAPALRVTATDEAGGSITQTVTAAYGLAQGSIR